MKKVFLAALLCLLSVFLFNSRTADVQAEGIVDVYEADELEAAATDCSIKLGSDIILTQNIVFNNSTLDLNGHTLHAGNKAIIIKGKCTIKDSSASQNGKICNSNNGATYIIQVGPSPEYGELSFESGKIEAYRFGVYVINGKMIMDGGEIKSQNSALIVHRNSEAIINDGYITSETSSVVFVRDLLTVNGGHIETLGNSEAIHMYNDSSVVINGGVIKALYVDPQQKNGGRGVAAFKNASFTMAGGSIESCSFGIAGSGAGSDLDPNNGTGATFIIKGGSVTSQYGAGIYAPQVDGVVNISGGTVTGACGIEIRSGELDISGGTVIGAKDGFSSSNAVLYGDYCKGCAVSIVQHTTKQPISVNISGGTFYGYIPFNEGNYLQNPEEDIARINYSITGGTFVSSSDHAIKVEDMKNGRFVKGGKYKNSTNNSVANLSSYIVEGYGEFEETPETSPDSFWMVRPARNLEITDNGLGKASAEYKGKAYYNGVLVNDMFFADMPVSLKAVPNEGYVLNKWEIVSGKADISKDRFIMPDDDLKLKAIFATEAEETEEPEELEEPPVTFVKDFLDPLKEKFEDAIANKGKQTVYWNEGDSLSYDIMKLLEEHPDITLVFDYTYNDKDYHVVIPGRYVKADPAIDWYGPLYLYAHFGRYSLTDAAQIVAGASSGTYVIRPGDTLGSIANRLNTTVKYLADTNGITDPNRIYSGRELRY